MKPNLMMTMMGVALMGLLQPAAAQAPAAAARGPLINISLGSVGSSSGVYAFSVSLSNAVRKHDPGIVVTAVEGGGGFDHARLMKQGVLDWSISGSPAVASAVRKGESNFQKEGAWEPVRLMFMRNVSVSRIYVRADQAARQNIRSWSDLAGKRFNPGIPGTRDMTRLIDANKVLGTGVILVPGSQDDAMRGIKEGGLVGMAKGGAPDRFDSGMLEAHHSSPLTVIGFSKAEADRLQSLDPFNTLGLTARGSIRELPAVGGFYEMNSSVMVMNSSRMSQETAYRIMKAIYAGWAEIVSAYPPAKGTNPIADAVANIPNAPELLLHAGVVQYAREVGINVPDRLVPPEYKAVR